MANFITVAINLEKSESVLCRNLMSLAQSNVLSWFQATECKLFSANFLDEVRLSRKSINFSMNVHDVNYFKANLNQKIPNYCHEYEISRNPVRKNSIPSFLKYILKVRHILIISIIALCWFCLYDWSKISRRHLTSVCNIKVVSKVDWKQRP